MCSRINLRVASLRPVPDPSAHHMVHRGRIASATVPTGNHREERRASRAHRANYSPAMQQESRPVLHPGGSHRDVKQGALAMNKTASRFLVSLVVVMMLALVAACSAPTAAPSPTAAPAPKEQAAAPTKAPEATKPAEPTKAAAPAKTVDFPEKGKSINWIIPYPAGGGSDVAVRITQPYFEKAIGATVNITNKGGAGSQVGITEAVKAKPDGYTVGHANWPTIITLYQDKDRKAAFSRKDFLPVAAHVTDPLAIAVKADSPYK